MSNCSVEGCKASEDKTKYINTCTMCRRKFCGKHIKTHDCENSSFKSKTKLTPNKIKGLSKNVLQKIKKSRKINKRQKSLKKSKKH